MTVARLAGACRPTALPAGRAIDDLDHPRFRAGARAQPLAAARSGETVAPETRDRAGALGPSGIEVPGEGHPPMPAFVVACDDGKRERTTRWAPEPWWAPEQCPVAFRVVHAEKRIEALRVHD